MWIGGWEEEKQFSRLKFKWMLDWREFSEKINKCEKGVCFVSWEKKWSHNMNSVMNGGYTIQTMIEK